MKKSGGGPRQQFQPGPQHQLGQQSNPGFPTMLGQQHIPQHYGNVNGQFVPYTGDKPFFQRLNSQSAAGRHPMFGLLARFLGG